MQYFKSAIFSVPKKVNVDSIFEAIRKSKEKGGYMLGIHVNLNPVPIAEYGDTFELTVVEIGIAKTYIRILTWYGPQETWDLQDKVPFFTSWEKEISLAESEGWSVIIKMDANSKLGKHYIKDDPHPISENEEKKYLA